MKSRVNGSSFYFMISLDFTTVLILFHLMRGD